jgi:cyclophilin family peptidyl-prolyl cis-trans isomerase
MGASAEPPPACRQYVPFQITPRPVDRPPARPPRGRLTAVVRTNCGTLEITLDARRFPRTVASFVHLARHHVYDGTSIHRVVRGRLIQGGDPTGTGTGGAGYAVRERPPRGTAYPRGTVAMARPEGAPPGTSSSQFFIVTGDDAELPPVHAVIGHVTGGRDVLRRIDGLGDASGEPAQHVPILTVRVREGR